MDFQSQIATLPRPLFDESLTLPAISDSDVPFGAAITDASLRVGKIQYQQALGNGSSHESTISTRAAFKNTQESMAATAQFVNVEEIPVRGASRAVVQVHSGFFDSVSIQVAIGYGIHTDQGSPFAFEFILTWRVEVVYASYGSNMSLWQGINPARDRRNRRSFTHFFIPGKGKVLEVWPANFICLGDARSQSSREAQHDNHSSDENFHVLRA